MPKSSNLWLWIAGALILFAGGAVVYSGTRGLRNNNPGNIALTNPPTAWEGVQTPNTDGTFVQFTTAEYGIRALAHVLNNYYAEGYQTVTAIVTRYAPPDSNDTDSYIADVSSAGGVDPAATLNFPADLTWLIPAIIVQENGLNPYSDATIAAGINLA